jgi:hypothetical protein
VADFRALRAVTEGMIEQLRASAVETNFGNHVEFRTFTSRASSLKAHSSPSPSLAASLVWPGAAVATEMLLQNRANLGRRGVR